MDHEFLPELVVIPLGEVSRTDWSISFISDFKTLLLQKDGKLEECIRSLLEQEPFLFENNIKTIRTLNTVQFLLIVSKDEKRILLFSPEAAQEKAITEWSLRSIDSLSVEGKERLQQLDNALKLANQIPEDSLSGVIDEIIAHYKLPNIIADDKFNVQISQDVQEGVNQLVQKVSAYRSNLMEHLTNFALKLTADFALFRVHLLKFVAILPSLDHDYKGKEVKRMLLEALRRLLSDSQALRQAGRHGVEGPIPAFYQWGLQFVYWLTLPIPSSLLANIVRFKIKFMAKRFIAGTDIQTADSALQGLLQSNRFFTVDQLGELVVSEKEADYYCDKVLELVDGMAQHVSETGKKNSAGILVANVSLKVSALCSDFRPEAFDYTYNLVAPRLKKILLRGREKQVFINIDAEHYHFRDLVFKIYEKALLETPELHDYDQTGIVVQAYLRDGLKHFYDILKCAQTRKLRMPIRLVKGAYWDAETIEGDAHNFPAPQFLNKCETDINFRLIAHEMLKHGQEVQLVIASHNIHDHVWVEVVRKNFFAMAPVIEHQCLHMTYEALSTGMSQMGWPVRNYVPIGSLIMGMGYLVRRIMENSSQTGFLTMMRSHKFIKDVKGPELIYQDIKKNNNRVFDIQTKIDSAFHSCFPLRLYVDSDRHVFEKELQNFQQHSLGKSYTARFGGEEKTIYSSSNPEIIVGKIPFVQEESVLEAVKSCGEEKKIGWGQWPAFARAITFIRAANLMVIKRSSLAALVVYEAGKSLYEALADIDEAIDFLNFYAREEMRLQNQYGEKMLNRGVLAVISPWNFPIAIPCGMAGGALIAGNTVVLKSASTTPLCAQVLVDLMHEAGIPPNALIHLPGSGRDVGAPLQNHLDINGVVFTGSKKVGVQMFKNVGARISEGEHREMLPNRVITEMGGKNAIIVTGNAELDETIAGCLYSAFAHAGQKCSAASRIIVDEQIKDRFIERFKEAVLDIKVGAAFDGATYINPLISASEKKRAQQDVQEAIRELGGFGGKLIADRSQEKLDGFCMGPVVMEISRRGALDNSSYACREMFAPVVHIIPYDGLDEALEIFNATEYALTGGIYSQSQDDIDYCLERMVAGNLYVNRPNTGARVAIEPFGGMKMSGTGPKAGSSSYIKAFHRFENALVPYRSEEGKAILENFKHWLFRDFSSFCQKKHENHPVPGQISQDDYSLIKQHGILLAQCENPSVIAVINFMTAVSIGTKVKVLASNDQAYQAWKSIIRLAQSWGLGKHHPVLQQVPNFTGEVWQRNMENAEVEFIISDAPAKELPLIYRICFEFKNFNQHMLSLFCDIDSPCLYHWEDYGEQFINKRSQAINTMRHGAPLEVKL